MRTGYRSRLNILAVVAAPHAGRHVEPSEHKEVPRTWRAMTSDNCASVLSGLLCRQFTITRFLLTLVVQPLLIPSYTDAEATVVTDLNFSPELVQSADGLTRFTLTDICHDWPVAPDAPFTPKRPISEESNSSHCASGATFFIGELSARQDDRSWRVLWSEPFPIGFGTTRWKMDDNGRLLVAVWFVDAEQSRKILIFDRAGLRYVHDLNKVLRDAGLPWAGRVADWSTWQGDVRFSENGQFLLIDMIPTGTPVHGSLQSPLQATLSLTDGKLALSAPDRWETVRQEVECRLMVDDAKLRAANPDIIWNDRGEGTKAIYPAAVRIWNRITARLSASIAPTKAQILLRFGVPCRAADDKTPPP